MEQFYKQGEFTHDSSNPFLSFVSSVLDITIIKPIIEGCIGKDLITGEAFDWPVPVTMMLSLATGITVSISGNKLLFKNADGIEIGAKTLSDAEVKKIGDVLDETTNSSFANKNLGEVLKQQGLTLEEFNKLRLTDVKDLTKEQIAQMKAIREAVPKIDANTYIQKTITASDIDKYIGEDGWSTIGGYVARYDDVSHIKGYDNVVAIFDGKHFVEVKGK